MTTQDVRIPLMRPLLPEVDQLLPYLRQIDQTRWYSNFGPMVDAFEKRLAALLGLSQETLVCVASGTVGLTLAIRAFEAKSESYCVMPSWTFAASAHAARWAQMRPWFVDVDEATWMITPEIVFKALKEIDGPVGAVMAVSAFGAPVDVAGWDAFRQETGIPVLIDAAAAFDGARFGEAPQVVSLHATKVLGIGEGALIGSLDKTLSARMRALSNFGFVSFREADTCGTNAKISEYTAAVGMAALDRWPETRAAFARAAALYQDVFADTENVAMAPGVSGRHVRSTFNVRLTGKHAGVVMSFLAARGIASRQWWSQGCHRMPAFRDMPCSALPVTEALGDSVIGLPISQDITAAEICEVRDAVIDALSR